jgi:8-amino-7-oxononanoate synthase
MPEHNFLERLKNETEARRQAGLGRELLPVTGREGASVVMGDRAYLNFSSNDFLGLAQNPELAETLAQLCRRSGSGSGASRLVTGTTRSTLDAEQALADYFGYESCLILGSGSWPTSRSSPPCFPKGTRSCSTSAPIPAPWPGCGTAGRGSTPSATTA